MTESTVIISNRSRAVIMVGLFLGMFIASFNGTVVEVCGPIIASELNGGALFAWMTVIYMLCETITIPIAGKLSDKYGRRPLFLIGCGIFLLGSLLAGLSNSIEMFLFSRALQGFGGGIMIPVSTAAVGDLYDSHKRGKMLGMINSLFAIGSGIGPIIGGYIAEVTSWHWAFFVNVPLFVICFAIVASRYPKTERKSAERMDYLGTALISAAILIILLLFQFAGSEFDWFSAQSLLMIGSIILLLFGFVIAEKRARDPLMPLHLFKNRTIAASVLYLLIIGIIMFGSLAYISFLGIKVLGFTPMEAGIFTLGMGLGMTLMSFLSGMLLERTGYRIWLMMGPVLCCVGLLAMSKIVVDTTVGYYVVSSTVLGLGVGCVMSILVTAAQNSAEQNEMGVTTSAVSMMRNIGSTVGTAVFAGIINGRLSQELAGTLPGDVYTQVPHDTGILDDEIVGLLRDLADGTDELLDRCVSAVANSIDYAFLVGGCISIFVVILAFFFKGRRDATKKGKGS